MYVPNNPHSKITDPICVSKRCDRAYLKVSRSFICVSSLILDDPGN